jgi:hypothetical protein
MQIHARTIDDFKTDRKGISPPLPVYLRILPIVFYLTIAAAILLNGLFVLRLSQADKDREASLARDKGIKAEIATATGERKAREKEAKKASDILAWLDSSRPLQPLLVAIARSIEPGSSLLSLRLDRPADNPTQIKFSIRLASDSARQLDLTLAKVADLRFRAFSPQQTVENGEFDYKATLIWQDSSARKNEKTAAEEAGS